MAALQADKFADTAFVQWDLERAYHLLSDEMKEAWSFEQFKDLISGMHPSKHPLSVKAVEYEPIPGQKAINIFLYGENEDEKFYYRFMMEGVKDTDYKLSGLWRGIRPYPPSTTRKPLK